MILDAKTSFFFLIQREFAFAKCELRELAFGKCEHPFYRTPYIECPFCRIFLKFIIMLEISL